MLREQRKLARHLKSLIKKLGYNNEDLYGGCVIVSCWIISRAIDDQEYIDNFFEFYLKVNFLPDNKEAPVHLSEAFQYCEPYFKQWTKNPATGHLFAPAFYYFMIFQPYFLITSFLMTKYHIVLIKRLKF
jgi:hypothetical protein